MYSAFLHCSPRSGENTQYILRLYGGLMGKSNRLSPAEAAFQQAIERVDSHLSKGSRRILIGHEYRGKSR
jgi:hypothetical protein